MLELDGVACRSPQGIGESVSQGTVSRQKIDGKRYRRSHSKQPARGVVDLDNLRRGVYRDHAFLEGFNNRRE